MALLDTKLGMYQMQGNPDSQSPEEMGMDEKEPLLLQSSSPSLEESSPPHITMWWVRDRDLWRLTESPKWRDYSKIEFRQGIYFIFLINDLLFFFKTLSCNFFFIFLKFSNSIFFHLLATLHGWWDLSSPTGDGTQAIVVKAPNPNHWTTREFPRHIPIAIDIDIDIDTDISFLAF